MRLVLTVALCCAFGCLKSTPFECTENDQCSDNGTAGRCEPTGFCSFPDGTCPDGNRYGEASGDLAGQCVGAQGGDGGPPTVCLDVAQMTLGGEHTCVLTQTGEVSCWGRNTDGELGDDSTQPSSTPVQVGSLPAMEEVAAGDDHTCARSGDGSVRCWGRNTAGQLGDGTTLERTLPAAVAGLGDATQLEAGYHHTCAVRAGGTAVCWGSNADGQLGNGLPSPSNQQAPVDVVDPTAPTQPLAGVSYIVGGRSHSCAIVGTGVMCWGQNDESQLGDTTNIGSLVPVSVVGLVGTPVKLAAGENHTCALTDADDIYCWGHNADGQLGNNSTVESATAVAVTMAFSAADIDAGHDHTCARDVANAVYCWGENDFGQLGTGAAGNALVPVQVASDAPVFGVGGLHTCATDATGSIACWGRNNGGQLAAGDPLRSFDPVTVSAPVVAADSIATGTRFTCALSSGAVHCWGNNSQYQLGDGTTQSSAIPVAPRDSGSALTGATAVRAEVEIACALKGGDALCWGQADTDASDSVDGDDHTIETPRLIVDSVGRPIVDVSVGVQNMWVTTSVDPPNKLWAWGDNADHICGIRGDTNSVGVARQVDYFLTADVIANGATHTCVLVAGQVQCIGSNSSGRLGDPDAQTSNGADNPVVVTDLPAGTVDALVAADDHTCALIAGAVHCWGDNDAGQLGDGSRDDTSVQGVAKVVLPADDATAIALQTLYSCALRAGDELWCWGDNSTDLFRTGATGDDALTPAQVPGITASQVALGDGHICVIDSTDGAVKCWGSNVDGEIGLDRPFSKNTPSATVVVCEP